MKTEIQIKTKNFTERKKIDNYHMKNDNNEKYWALK